MRISDWSSDVCSSDLPLGSGTSGIATSPACANSRHTPRATSAAVIPISALTSPATVTFYTVRPELVEGPFFFPATSQTRTVLRQAQHKRGFGLSSERNVVVQIVVEGRASAAA